MSLEICGCGGRMCFYQWDKGRKLQDREMSLGSTSQAHFTNSVTGEVLATEFYNDDGVMRCPVPDVLLQADSPLDVMVYTTNEHGEYTETHAKFQVRSRPMPPEYTYRTADEAVAEHNETILALTGTEQPTAVDAVVELNATLATHLNAKGIEVEPSETAEVLVGMVDSIPHPADAYAEGVAEGVQTTNTDVLSVTGTAQPTAVEAVTEVNATLASILTDKGVEADASETTEALVGKASEIKVAGSWIEEWARQCTVTGKLKDAEITEVGDLYFEKATEVSGGLFQDNTHITKVGNITAPLEVGRYGASAMFYNCTNLLSVGDITLYGVTIYGSSGIERTFSYCTKLQTAGFIDAPNYMSISYLCSSSGELVTFGGFNTSRWGDGQSAFVYCKKLREITHPIDFISCTQASEMFRECYALEYLRFAAGSLHCKLDLSYSTKLSAESWESVFYGLADLTGQTACTLTIPANPENSIPQALRDLATARNWTIAERQR